MIEIRQVGFADLPSIRDLFSRANDAPYPFDPVADEKLRKPGFEGPLEITVATRKNAILGAAVLSGKYLRLLAVDRNSRRQGIGSLLVREAEERVGERSDRIVVAAEPGNYFTPGVYERDSTTIAFLERRGFLLKAEAVNLTAALLNNSRLVESAPMKDISVTRVSSAEKENLLKYVDSEFGRIWAFEVAGAFDHATPTVFIARREDQVVGFSAHSANNSALGGYGPAGTSKAVRGRGIGRELLLACLRDQRDLGYERALIQWAAAIPFYKEACGAVPSETFMIFEKRLAQSVKAIRPANDAQRPSC